jgi:predicted transcriptional regulator
MSDAEQINEKLDEVKEAIENIDIPNNSDLGLIINESLTNNFTKIEKQLREINSHLSNLCYELRNIQSRIR